MPADARQPVRRVLGEPIRRANQVSLTRHRAIRPASSKDTLTSRSRHGRVTVASRSRHGRVTVWVSRLRREGPEGPLPVLPVPAAASPALAAGTAGTSLRLAQRGPCPRRRDGPRSRVARAAAAVRGRACGPPACGPNVAKRRVERARPARLLLGCTGRRLLAASQCQCLQLA